MKVAIVYDRVNKWGGAERVLLLLHKLFPKAPLYTSVYDPKKAPWAKVFRVKTSFLQHIPFIQSHHELFPYLMPFAFRSFSFTRYDVVISVTSEYAKGIITVGKTKHVCICLTPTRYLWSGYNEYFTNNFIRFLVSPILWLLRRWDKHISQFPDTYIAISQEVQKRIRKYYAKDSLVVYPPVSISKKTKDNPLLASNFFLVVSRLSRFTRYKRVDLAIKAATLLGASLLVVGSGNRKQYRKIAGPTVQFVGNVSDSQLALYYRHCQALIFPGYEDFGLVMVEALSFGKPVIAYAKGGALEIVTPGKTGMLFAKQTVGSLVKSLKSFQKSTYNSAICQKEAKRFSEKAFAVGIKKALRQVV